MALRKFIFINATEGFHEEQAATDELSLGKVTAVGVGGIAFDASNQRIVNVATPTAASDAASKSYVDAVVSGLDVKKSVRLATAAALPAYTAAGSGVGKTLTGNANGALSVDGVAVAANDRILVMAENSGGAHVDHGIYTVTATGSAMTAFVLTRATDADENAEVTAGLFTFVEEGTTYADTGWILITNNPIVVDTTALDFTQFSAANVYTFDQGLLLTGASVTVELDTTADAQGAGAGGGSSGLEFDVNTAAGKLRAAVSATRAINRFSDGLGIEIDPQANTAGSNPSAAVSATGLTVVRAPKVEENYTADEAVAVGDPVAWSTTVNDRFVKGRADDDAKARIFGVARTLTAAGAQTAAIVTAGVAAGTLSGATVGTPYYLGATGGLTTTIPASGNRVIQCGIAKNATDLFVRVVDYGKKTV